MPVPTISIIIIVHEGISQMMSSCLGLTRVHACFLDCLLTLSSLAVVYFFVHYREPDPTQ